MKKMFAFILSLTFLISMSITASASSTIDAHPLSYTITNVQDALPLADTQDTSVEEVSFNWNYMGAQSGTEVPHLSWWKMVTIL